MLVGAVGFAVDAGILTALNATSHLNLYVCRLFSFSAATLVTWYLNRRFVFTLATTRAPGYQYARYLLVQTGGALINLLVFYGLIRWNSQLRGIPVLPLMVGAAFGLVFNFSASRIWAFREDRE